MNISSDILDEIALEGLDGITIEALWVRLLQRKGFLLPPKDEHCKLYIWNIVRRLRDVEFYQLETPRLPLVVFDRWNYLEEDLGLVTEPDPLPVDIYPHCLISDTDNKIQGSCSTYHTRQNVSFTVRKLQLTEIFEKYGAERIVIVANQSVRRAALMGPHHIPDLELTDFQYCCLERVGRSRYHGEVTQGKMGLQGLGVDPKTIYYFRKFLSKQKLITKQMFHMRARNVSIGGRLIHLPRFYRTVKPKFVTLTESVIDLLMTQPDYMCEVNKIKETLGISFSLKKLINFPEFQKYVRSDPRIPYRTLYPNADTKQWKHKSADKEKVLHVLYLVDPTIDTKEIKRRLEGNDEDEDEDEEDSHSQGFLERSARCLDRPIALQVWKILEQAGPNGLSASELTRELGISKLNMRTICKNMLKSNLIASFMQDVARQRVTRYIVNSGTRLCDVTAEFASEEIKFSSLTKTDDKLPSNDIDSKLSLTNVDDKRGSIDSDSKLCSTGVFSKPSSTDVDCKRGSTEVGSRLTDESSIGKGCSEENRNSKSTITKSTSKIIQDDGNENDVSLLMTVTEEPDENMEAVEGGREEKEKKFAVIVGEGKRDVEKKKEDVEKKKKVSVGRKRKRDVGIIDEKEEKKGEEKEAENVVVEEGSKEEGVGGGNIEREDDKSVVGNSKLLQECSSRKASLKRGKNKVEKTGSSSPKKLKLKVKSVVELNKEKEIDENIEKSVSEPMESVSDETNVINDSNSSISEPSTENVTSNESCKIDVEITDDLDWLKLRGRVGKEIDGYKTVRSLKRWNWILETVQSLKVINGLKNLHMVIDEKEKESRSRIDRKSLLRILYKMALDKLIKVYQVTVKSGDIIQEMNFICSPLITPDDPQIKISIDLAKLKFSSKVKLQNETAVKPEPKEPVQPLIKEEMVLTNKYDFGEEHKSNVDVPKFMRMRYLHIFMYYLVYGYEGNVDLDQEEAAQHIRAMNCSDSNDLESMSFIYVPSISWKMFVPPLPQHREYKTGWSLLADVILRLPLSMFLQLVRLPYIIPNLELYVDHPIKRHTLVKDLPIHIRNCLTFRRKYVFSIYEVMERLAYIGLVQVGQQSFKDKDHVYVYLNKNALLLDTKTSRPGYHKVSEDLVYSEIRYNFGTMINVEQYWLDMWKICMHTKLGSRSCVVGTELILENIRFKPDMIELLKPRTREEVLEEDVGYLPGDRLGAAGFDSALFSHLKRNWSFKPFPRARKTECPVSDKPKINAKKPFKFAEGKNQMVYSLLAKRRKNFINTARKQSVLIAKNTALRHSSLPHKPRVTIRKVKPKRNLKHRQPFYDEVDRQALQRMNKLRVDWSKAEDKLLLLCKVVLTMIEPPPKSAILGNTYIPTREILHKTFPASRNKTSRACQRRTNYMLRSQSTCQSLNVCIEELRHDPSIMEVYGDLFEKLKAKYEKNRVIKNKAEFIAEWNMHYKNLFEILAKRFDGFSMLSLSGVTTTIPDTIEEFYAQYNVIEPTNKVKAKPRFNPVESVNDIYCSVINSTIHSALCCSSDKTSWSFHLFSVYQQYPEKILRVALAKMRTSLMVSLKRAWAKTKMRSGNYLPLTASPYRLSISYINLMAAKYTFDIFAESYEVMKTLAQSNQMDLQTTTGGATAGVLHLVTGDLLDFKIQIPDQVIVLNPNIPEKDEKYSKLLKRYKELLANCRQELTTTCLMKNDLDDLAENSIEEDSYDNSNKDVLASNTIARNASRIALYLVKDSEEIGGLVPHDIQHVHDFFVVNSCSILSNIRPDLTEDQLKVITDLSDVENVQKRLKEQVIFPGDLMTDLNDNEILKDNFSGDKFDLAVKLMELAKSEGNLGLLCGRIMEEFGNNWEVKRILDELCKLKMLVCTGVVYTTYVHYKHARPWLVHTFKNKRKDRESRVPMVGGVMELEKKEEKEERVDERLCEEESKNQGKEKCNEEEVGGKKEKKSEGYNEGDLLVVDQEDGEEKEGERMFVLDLIKSGKISENKSKYDNKMEVDCENVVQEKIGVENEKKDEESSCRKEVVLEEVENEEECDRIFEERSSKVQDDRSDEGFEQNDGVGNDFGKEKFQENKETFVEVLKENDTVKEDSEITGKEEVDTGFKGDKYIQQVDGGKLGEVLGGEKFCFRKEGSVVDKQVSNEDLEGGSFIGSGSSMNKKEVFSVESLYKIGQYSQNDKEQIYPAGGLSVESLKDTSLGEGCSKDLVNYRLEENRGVMVNDGNGVKRSLSHEECESEISSGRKRVRFQNSTTETYLRSGSESKYKDLNTEGEISLKSSSNFKSGNLTTAGEASLKSESNSKSSDTSVKTRSNTKSEILPSTSKDTDNRNLTNPIKILIRPWVKIDGSINRRSLDYLLTTVLSHIMLHPLATLAELQERFLPALQPQHTRELAEILHQIKCVESYICERHGKVTLFSKPCEVVLKKATGLEPPSEIRYEAVRDAIINLGKLISTKQYNESFLSMLTAI